MFYINNFEILINRSSEFFISLFMCGFILVFFMFPLNKYLLNKITNSQNFNNSDAFSVNIIIHSFIFLIFSFYNINKEVFAIIVIILSIITNLVLLKKNFNKNTILITSIFLIFFISYSIYITSFAALEWDGLASWFYKTKIFYQGGNVEDLNKVPFSFYPHLGPYIWSFFWKISQNQYEYVGRFFYVLIFLLSSLSIASKIKNEQIKIIFYICIILFLTETTLFGGYQEYFMYSLITVFSSFFFFFDDEFRNNKIKFSILYLIILNVLPWIKDEGLVGTLILLFIILFSKKYKKLELFIFALILILGLFFSWKLEQSLKGNIAWQFEMDFQNFLETLLDLNFIINILLSLLIEIIKCFIRYPIWLGILLAAIILNINSKIHKLKYTKLLSVTLFLQIIIFFVGYIFLINYSTSNVEIWHLQTSTYRLMLQISGLYVVLLINLINVYEKSVIKV